MWDHSRRSGCRSRFAASASLVTALYLRGCISLAQGVPPEQSAGTLGPAPTSPMPNGTGVVTPPALPTSAAPAVQGPPVRAAAGVERPGALTLPVAARMPLVGSAAAEFELPGTLTPRPGGLTADEAGRRAARLSPGTDVARAAAAYARGQQSEALWQIVPTVAVSARYSRLSPLPASTAAIPNVSRIVRDANLSPPVYTCADNPGSDPGCTMPLVIQEPILDQYAFRASLVIPLSDIPLRLAQFYIAAGLVAEARDIDASVAAGIASLTGREAFFEYLRALGQEALAAQAVTASEQRRADAQRLFDAGRLPRTELLRAAAASAELRRVQSSARDGVTLTESQLRQLTGFGPREPLTVGEHLDAGHEVSADLASLIRQAGEGRAELRSIERQIRAVGANINAARAAEFPSVAVAANFDYANPNPRFFPQVPIFIPTWDLTAQVTWSPTQALVAGATVSRLRAQQNLFQAQLRQVRQSVENEVRAHWSAARGAASRLVSARVELAAAEEAYRARRDMAAAGTASMSELLDAETERLRAGTALVNATIDLRIAAARLQRATGEPTAVAR